VTDLLNVDQALERVLARFAPLSGEAVDLLSAFGRVLAEDIHANADVPPFANSSMDGFAVLASDIASADKNHPVQLRLVMDIPAGSAPMRPLYAGEAARIMTGAPLPEGADAVVPVEDTDNQWTPGKDDSLPSAVTVYRSVEQGSYVRLPGEDVRAGQVVLEAGTLLRPAEIGVLASLGVARVPVVRQPRVAIVSTGDELVGIDEPLAPGKIRDSNSYGLAALVASYGGIPIRIPVARDTLKDVRDRFQEALTAKPDIILSSAGVSVGAFDVVRTVIEELGEVNFWRINLRPGKPLAFGHVGGIPFFGLPGNPVSAMVTFDVFVRPALLKLGCRPDPAQIISAAVAEDMHSDGRRSYLRVKLERENGQFVARTTGTQSSGALMSMVLADGLMIVPENRTHIAAGEHLPVRVLRDEVLSTTEVSDDKR
jgi:molybdopterin molybdotransferase